jgi:asparagine N-glycosylation enzyme membrane subunit Stt3
MGHSTETALLCVTEALHTAKADFLSSVFILDLSATSDTLNNQILLSTLSGLGVSGSALFWIASYLADHI